MKRTSLFFFIVLLIAQNQGFAQAVLKANVGHANGAREITFSPDGRFIYTTGQVTDEQVKVLDAATGKEIRTLDKGGGNKIILGKNNDFYMEGGGVFIVRHNINTGELIHRYKYRMEIIKKWALNDKHNILASWNELRDEAGYGVRLYNIQTKQMYKTIKTYQDYVQAIDISEDGTMLLVVKKNSAIVYDMSSGTVKYTLEKQNIEHGEFTKNYLLISTKDGKMHVYNNRNAYAIKSYAVDTDRFDFVVDQQLDILAVSSWKTNTLQIKLYNLTNGQLFNVIQENIEFGASRIEINPKGRQLVMVDFDGIYERKTKAFDMYTGDLLWVNEPKVATVYGVEMNKNNNMIHTYLDYHEEIPDFVWSLDGTQSEFAINSDAYTTSRSETANIDDVFHSTWVESDFEIKYFKKEHAIKVMNKKTNVVIRSFTNWEGEFYKGGDVSPDGRYAMAGISNHLYVWDLVTGGLIKHQELKHSFLSKMRFSRNSKYLTFRYVMGTFLMRASDFSMITNIQKSHESRFSDDSEYLAVEKDNSIEIYNMYGELEISLEKNGFTIQGLDWSDDNQYLVGGTSEGAVLVWDLFKEKRLFALYAMIDGKNWLAIAPDGRFDGTAKGMSLLHLVKDNKVVPLESMFEKLYTPNLIASVMSGDNMPAPEIDIKNISLPPIVKIINPQSGKASGKQVTLEVEITDQGGGIDEVLLYHNGKLVQTTQRGFKAIAQPLVKTMKSFTIDLVNGQNKIKVLANNTQRIESLPDEIILTYQGQRLKPDLHLLVVGINEYKNPRYNLNYAFADADAFMKKLQNGGKTIFENVTATFINDSDATKANIVQAFKNINAQATPDDVFVFYYAGHGVMSEADKPQFYLVPHDITQLYGEEDVLSTKGVSAKELQDLSRQTTPQKQLFVLDACQSGGMVEHLAMRGAAEEKAIAQLARATGTYWLTASGSEQFATEFKTLGHGLFTYTLLKGLAGEADGRNQDKKITVEELSAYIKDQVPVLSEQYKGQPQYPISYVFGNDFPVVVIE